MNIILSVLIPSIPEKITYLSRMVSELERQSKDLPVEIVVLLDNKQRTIGAKRNALVDMAQGSYITFVDDDDRIETDYIHSLLETIKQNPGVACITFDVEVNLGGLEKKICKYDVGYIYSNDENFYYRKPNHLMCYSRNIAMDNRFLDVSYGEDDEWAERASQRIQSQAKINKVLYYYDYMFKRPIDNPLLRQWEDHIMHQALHAVIEPEGILDGLGDLSRNKEIIKEISDQTVEYPLDANLVCFIHAYAINDWQDTLSRQLKRLKDTGLYEKFEGIFLTIVTSDGEFRIPEFILEYNKIQYQISHQVQKAQRVCLEWMHQYCLDSPKNKQILYIHTKGVTKFGTAYEANVKDWVHLMETFLIDNHSLCLQHLVNTDACGINYIELPQPHFSGNFWWANSHYIRKLNASFDDDYRAAEMWLLSHESVRFCSLFHSQVDHYVTPFPLNMMSMEIEPVVLTKENCKMV